jgi:hypothetical protein
MNNAGRDAKSGLHKFLKHQNFALILTKYCRGAPACKVWL